MTKIFGLTLQQAFNKAAAGIIKQGGPAVRRKKDGGRACVYRAAGGKKCAFGHLLPDELYSRKFEGRLASHVIDKLADKYPNKPSLKRLALDDDMTGTLDDLQNIHDRASHIVDASPDKEKFFHSWAINMVNFASRHHLKVPKNVKKLADTPVS